ncbi:MAG: TIGR04282 family arsenosugar biosynthesis glycosyltransferase [bacterium]|nr:TIGR04282 family arsenosugar biosynthesis glycosyltransferase [bacterium]
MRSIVLFSKAPEPGKVKTRLASHMSDIDAASFHAAFVLDTLDSLSALENTDRYLACYPDKEHTFFKELEENFDIKAFNQQGGDLGKKMENAFLYLRDEGYKEIVLIGSDSPTLPVEILNEAFERLKKNELVIGPSFDGGYYLIGISGEVPDIFGGIEWGENKVFEETLKKAKDCKVDFSILPFWYDIDTIKELSFMQIHLDDMNEGRCARTRTMVKLFNETNGGMI